MDNDAIQHERGSVVASAGLGAAFAAFAHRRDRLPGEILGQQPLDIGGGVPNHFVPSADATEAH